jgi:hypothetical protein
MPFILEFENKEELKPGVYDFLLSLTNIFNAVEATRELAQDVVSSKLGQITSGFQGREELNNVLETLHEIVSGDIINKDEKIGQNKEEITALISQSVAALRNLVDLNPEFDIWHVLIHTTASLADTIMNRPVDPSNFTTLFFTLHEITAALEEEDHLCLIHHDGPCTNHES